MKTLKTFLVESVNESAKSGHVKTTIHELLSWYMGDTKWFNDWQTTNTMTWGEDHAQDIDDTGMAVLKLLKKNMHDVINVTWEDDGMGMYDIEFGFEGKMLSIQSVSPPFEVDESRRAKRIVKESRLGKDLELSDLRVGFPISVEKQGGMYVKGFIQSIKGDMIKYETETGDFGNVPFDSKKVSLPTYGSSFKTKMGEQIQIDENYIAKRSKIVKR